MEYALNYSILESVIYDHATDAENPKYDLNRQLIKEQNGIIVINRENMDSAVKKIVYNQARQRGETMGQVDLFG